MLSKGLIMPMSVTEALSAPDAKKWIKALEIEVSRIDAESCMVASISALWSCGFRSEWVFLRK